MNIRSINIIKTTLALAILISAGCVTKKKKGDIGWLKQKYHDTTAEFNGYFNADVIMDETFASLDEQHIDNYNKLLPIYPYSQTDNPKAYASEMDRAIEKVTIVALNHEPSVWVDDCYVLMGKAQFLKQDYETAEETFQYFEEEFNPGNPGSRVYNKSNNKKDSRERKKEEQLAKKKEQRDAKKQKEKERKAKEEKDQEEREQASKEREREKQLNEREKEAERKEKIRQDNADRKEREAARKEREDLKEEERKAKDRFEKQQSDIKDDIVKMRKDLSKAEQNRREQERKDKEKRRKNKKRDKKVDPKADPRSGTEIQLESGIKAKEAELETLKASYAQQEETFKQQAADRAIQREKDKSDKEAARIAAKAQKEENKIKDAEAKKIAKEEKAKRELEEENRLAEQELKAEEEEVIENLESEQRTKKEPQKVENGGLFKHKTVYSEGLLWLARTYIERENFGSAEFTLNKLGGTVPVTNDVQRQLPAAKAHLKIKKGEYSRAIPDLEEAIELSKENAEKSRYQYIIAQIHQMNGSAEEAKVAFQRVKKYKPGYDMEFNSQLSVARNAWRTGSGSITSVLKSLDKMARQEKNADYLDQIYFTKGEIKLASGDKVGALEDFREATTLSKGNTAQQTESFYNLASLYYELDDFVKAQNYYDSTATVLPKTDERYLEVQSRAKSLKPIARNIEIVERMDSLLALANLSESELKQWAQDKLDKQREDEEAVEDAAFEEQKPTKPKFNQKPGKASSFFAYNPITLDKGKRDFSRKWGTRKLEDDWRRSNKTSSLISGEDEESIDQDLASTDDDNALAEILRDVPQSSAQQTATNGKIEKALFELGKLFRSEIQNYEESIKALKRLTQDYPQTDHRLDAYYFLYLDYLDINDEASARLYADKIVSEFPDSDFAQLISNPNYAAQKAKEENNKEQYYRTTYSTFEQGDYQGVLARVEKAKEVFGKKNDYTAKLDLLKAMSIGGLEGKDEYVKALNDVISKHPKTDEETRAKEIVRFLKGDLDAFDNRIYDEAVEEFKVEDGKLHYVIVSVFDSAKNNIDNAKIKISSYNKKYHKSDNIKITDIFLNPESKSKLILLRRFDNKAQAMDFIDGTQKNPDDFINANDIAFDIFAITQRNYREVIKQKSINNYQVFFDKNYLK